MDFFAAQALRARAHLRTARVAYRKRIASIAKTAPLRNHLCAHAHISSDIHCDKSNMRSLNHVAQAITVGLRAMRRLLVPHIAWLRLRESL